MVGTAIRRSVARAIPSAEPGPRSLRCSDDVVLDDDHHRLGAEGEAAANVAYLGGDDRDDGLFQSAVVARLAVEGPPTQLRNRANQRFHAAKVSYLETAIGAAPQKSARDTVSKTPNDNVNEVRIVAGALTVRRWRPGGRRGQGGKDGLDDAGAVEPGLAHTSSPAWHARGRRPAAPAARTLQAAVQQAFARQEVQHLGGEAADRALLDGDQHLVLGARDGGTRSSSSGLAKRASATVVERPPAPSSSAASRQSCQPRAEGQQRHLGALAQDAALADLQARAALRHVDADAVAARIAEGDRAVVDRRPRCATMWRSSASSPAAITTMLGRLARKVDVEGAAMGRRHRRRRSRPGRSGSAPAGSGSPRRARPGRRRAAGRSNRSPRRASALRSRGRRRR